MYKIPTLTTRKRNDSDFVGTCSCKKWQKNSTSASHLGTQWMKHVKETHNND